jgi:glutamate 5-kinase
VTVPDTATAERADIATAARVVVKVGSSSLTTPDGEIDGMRIGALAAALSARRQDGGQVVLVSSGAIASGLVPLGLSKRPRDLATQQAAASVGQGLLIARYTAAFARHGIRTGQVLLSADDLMRRTHYRNAQRTLDRLLELGVLPVVNENDTVATDEIRFGDNDRLAALVAHVTRAGALILLSDVDGLYDGDPRRGGAQRITEVRDRADLDGIRLGRGLKAGQGAQGNQGTQDNRKSQGVGGMATKVEAAMIASAAGIPTVVADAASAATALGGGSAGTYFAAARGRRPATRLLWLKHAAVAHGSLRLDHGAVEAVVKRRASLLPAGITGVEGTFDAGDPVNLRDENGTIVARGLVNYDAAEIPGLMGRSTRWLASKLGPEYEREVVHRDDLVIVLAVPARGTTPERGTTPSASCRRCRCCRRQDRRGRRARGSAGGRTGRQPPGPRSRPRRGRSRSGGPGTGSTIPGRTWPRS